MLKHLRKLFKPKSKTPPRQAELKSAPRRDGHRSPFDYTSDMETDVLYPFSTPSRHVEPSPVASHSESRHHTQHQSSVHHESSSHSYGGHSHSDYSSPSSSDSGGSCGGGGGCD